MEADEQARQRIEGFLLAKGWRPDEMPRLRKSVLGFLVAESAYQREKYRPLVEAAEEIDVWLTEDKGLDSIRLLAMSVRAALAGMEDNDGQ